jgi:hypothetical protein
MAMLFFLVSTLGCSGTVLATRVLDGPASELPVPTVDSVRSSRFHTDIAAPFDTVWSRTVRAFASSVLLLTARKKDGFMFLVDVDGVHRGDKFMFAEFPLGILLEPTSDSTTSAHVLFLGDLGSRGITRGYKNVYLAAGSALVKAHLDRIFAEASGRARWPWLWNTR